MYGEHIEEMYLLFKLANDLKDIKAEHIAEEVAEVLYNQGEITYEQVTDEKFIRDLTAEPQDPASARSAPQRSPEEVRQMLSRYRTGLQRGRTEAAGPPVPPSAGAAEGGDDGGGGGQAPNGEDRR